MWLKFGLNFLSRSQYYAICTFFLVFYYIDTIYIFPLTIPHTIRLSFFLFF